MSKRIRLDGISHTDAAISEAKGWLPSDKIDGVMIEGGSPSTLWLKTVTDMTQAEIDSIVASAEAKGYTVSVE